MSKQQQLELLDVSASSKRNNNNNNNINYEIEEESCSYRSHNPYHRHYCSYSSDLNQYHHQDESSGYSDSYKVTPAPPEANSMKVHDLKKNEATEGGSGHHEASSQVQAKASSSSSLVAYLPLTAQSLALISGYRAPCIGIERYSKYSSYFHKKYTNPSPLDLYDGRKPVVPTVDVVEPIATPGATALLNALEEGRRGSNSTGFVDEGNRVDQTHRFPSSSPVDQPIAAKSCNQTPKGVLVDDFHAFYDLVRAIENGNAFEASNALTLPVITPPTVMDILLLEEQRVAAAAAQTMTTTAQQATASGAVAPIDIETSCHDISDHQAIPRSPRATTAQTNRINLQQSLSNHENILTHPINCYTLFGNHLSPHRLLAGADNPRGYDYLNQAPDIFSRPGYITDVEWQEYILKPLILIRNQANSKRWRLYHSLRKDCPFLPKTLTWTYRLKKGFDSIPGMIANFPVFTILLALLHLLLYVLTMLFAYSIDCYHLYCSNGYRQEEKQWFSNFLTKYPELDTFRIDETIVEEMHSLCESLNHQFVKLHFSVETKERFDEYVRLQQQLELVDGDDSVDGGRETYHRRYHGFESTLGGDSTNNGSRVGGGHGGRSVGSSVGGGSSVNDVPSTMISPATNTKAGGSVSSNDHRLSPAANTSQQTKKNRSSKKNQKRFQIFEDERLEHKTNAMFIKIQFNTYVPEEELIYAPP